MGFLESVIVRDTWGHWPALAAGARGDLAPAAEHLVDCSGPVVVALGDEIVGTEVDTTLEASIAAVLIATVLGSYRDVDLLVSTPTTGTTLAMLRAAGAPPAVGIQDVRGADRLVGPATDLVFVGAGGGPPGPGQEQGTAVLARAMATGHHSVAVVTGPHNVGVGRLSVELVREATGVDGSIPISTDRLVVAAAPLWGAWALCTAIALLNDTARAAAVGVLTLDFVARLTTSVLPHDLRQACTGSEGSELVYELNRSILAALTHVLDPSIG